MIVIAAPRPVNKIKLAQYLSANYIRTEDEETQTITWTLKQKK